MISMNVLIVDDNRLLCRAMATMIPRRRFFCHVVDVGKDALSEAGRVPYDIVFLDVHLPDANGLDLLQEIKRISPGTKVVIMSSDGSEINVRRALAKGAMRFLEKPFELSQIDEILEAALPGIRRTERKANHQAKPVRGRLPGFDNDEPDK